MLNGESAEINIVDVLGNLVYTAKTDLNNLSGYTINLESMNAGVYLINITTKNLKVSHRLILVK
jgi:hypothetical protein